MIAIVFEIDGEIVTTTSFEIGITPPNKSFKINIFIGEHRGGTGNLLRTPGSDQIIKVDNAFDITAIATYCKTKLGIFKGFIFYLCALDCF